MANKNLFKSLVGKLIPAADARNEENAPAYALTPKQALAQYAATGCLTQTFYAGAEERLAVILDLCEKVSPEFVAKTAVYASERGLMSAVRARGREGSEVEPARRRDDERAEARRRRADRSLKG
jgi:60 kDa SS-A/Ro ribonucleoprotein